VRSPPPGPMAAMMRREPRRPQGHVAIAARELGSGSRAGVEHGGWRRSASHGRYPWIAWAGPGRPGDVIVKVITGDIVAAVDDLIACRPRGDCHASSSGLPSSASQRRRSRRGDRLLRQAVPDVVAGALGRPAGAHGAEQCPDPVHQGPYRARDVATDRDLALRLARHRLARAPRSVPGAARRRVVATLHRGRRAIRSSSAATRGRARAACSAGRRRRSPTPRPEVCSRLAPAALHIWGVPTMPSWNTRATIRPSASTTCTCTRRIRSVRSSGISSTSTRRCTRGTPAARP
jgi:hypothetical protein